jgi:preprotein translocase subunit SecG
MGKLFITLCTLFSVILIGIVLYSQKKRSDNYANKRTII